jgi:hypothetical protein
VHTRIKIKYGRCRVYLHEGTLGGHSNGRALQLISGNTRRLDLGIKRSSTGCDVCRVPLCNNEYCWNSYHGLEVLKK